MSQLDSGSGVAGGALPKTWNLFAVVSFLFGITAACFPLAIVFGHVARRQIRRTGQRGAVLASTGLLFGYLFFWGIAFIVAVNFLSYLTR